MEHLAGLVVGLADAEVERAAHDDAELLVGVVVVQERALGAALDPPEPQLEVIADDHPPAEAGPIGLVEQVVVEEVAVLLRSRRIGVHSRRSTIRRSTSSRWATTAATALRVWPFTTASAIARCASVELSMISLTSARLTSAYSSDANSPEPNSAASALACTSLSSGLPHARASAEWNRRSISRNSARSCVLPRRDAGDLGALGVGGPAGGHLDDRRLDHLAHLEQLGHQRLAVVAGEVHLGQVLGDDRAVAAALEVAGDHEALDRLAHRRAGDAELLAQHPLGRQRRARRELPGVDGVGEALADLGRHGAARDRVEAGDLAHASPTMA